MPLASERIKFAATPRHKVVYQSKVDAPHGNFGVGVRVLKARIVNDGDKPVTVDLDGSPDDSGYGMTWTTRATVTVPARTNDVIEGAIRGSENNLRLTVQCTAGNETEGAIEIFEASDNYRR